MASKSETLICELKGIKMSIFICRDYIIFVLYEEKCEDQFRCGNGTCLNVSVRCNKVNDCLPEGLDEFGCGEFSRASLSIG